jgi:hypothetical protein
MNWQKIEENIIDDICKNCSFFSDDRCYHTKLNISVKANKEACKYFELKQEELETQLTFNFNDEDLEGTKKGGTRQ